MYYEKENNGINEYSSFEDEYKFLLNEYENNEKKKIKDEKEAKKYKINIEKGKIERDGKETKIGVEFL